MSEELHGGRGGPLVSGRHPSPSRTLMGLRPRPQISAIESRGSGHAPCPVLSNSTGVLRVLGVPGSSASGLHHTPYPGRPLASPLACRSWDSVRNFLILSDGIAKAMPAVTFRVLMPITSPS